MTVVYILPLSSMGGWEDNGSIYIYRRFYPKDTSYAWQRELFREEGFLWGPVFARKRGSESFWGKCLKRIRVSDNASFQKIAMGG